MTAHSLQEDSRCHHEDALDVHVDSTPTPQVPTHKCSHFSFVTRTSFLSSRGSSRRSDTQIGMKQSSKRDSPNCTHLDGKPAYMRESETACAWEIWRQRRGLSEGWGKVPGDFKGSWQDKKSRCLVKRSLPCLVGRSREVIS